MYSTSSYVTRTLVAFVFFSITASRADSYKGPTPPAVYTQECSSCHLAFPPNLLPKVSWQRVMNGLDKHYGSDASIEPAQVQQIGAWLQANAGTYKRVREEPADDRITRSAWFSRKHREVEASVWKCASVKSAAQCSACHTRADEGNFDEHQVRIPR